MPDIYVKTATGTIGSSSYRGLFTANQTYAVGDRVASTASSYFMYECIAAGAVTTEPTWVATVDSTTIAGGATFVCRIPSTWANATITLARATANDQAGDTIYLSHEHSETASIGHTLSFASTVASPVKVIAANDTSGEPPAVPASATLASSNTYGFSLLGSAYMSNLVFNSGTGTGSSSIGCNIDNTYFSFENCIFRLNAAGATSNVSVSSSSTGAKGAAEFKNCLFKTTNGYHKIILGNTTARFIGGGMEAGSSTAGGGTFGLISAGTSVDAEFRDFDFSALSSILNPIVPGIVASGTIKFINCKMPAGWTSNICGSTPPINPKFRATLWNCGAYLYKCEMASGMIIADSYTVKTTGAKEGETGYSWRFVTNANCNEHLSFVQSEVITIPCDTTGVKTVNVDFTSANALDDSQIWLEIDYLPSATDTLGGFATNKRATILTTPSAHPATTDKWTNGLTQQQVLQKEITVGKAGNIYVKVCVGKSSETIYVDYKATLT